MLLAEPQGLAEPILQAAGRDGAVGILDDVGDLIPIDLDVEADAEPAAVADVGRPEEALRVGVDERLLVRGPAGHQQASRSS